MNLDKSNTWLSLIANLGVLVGIVILIAEVNQSNRIATQDAFNDLSQIFNSTNLVLASDPQLAEVARFAATGEVAEPDSVLYQQLQGLAYLLFNNWNLVDVTYNQGQLPETDYPYWINDVYRTFERWPGLKPHFELILRSNEELNNSTLEQMYEAREANGIPLSGASFAMLEAVLSE